MIQQTDEEATTYWIFIVWKSGGIQLKFQAEALNPKMSFFLTEWFDIKLKLYKFCYKIGGFWKWTWDFKIWID